MPPRQDFLEEMDERIHHLRKLIEAAYEPMNKMSLLYSKFTIDYPRFRDMLSVISTDSQPETAEPIEKVRNQIEKEALPILERMFKEWKKITGDLKKEDKLMDKINKDFKDIDISKKKFDRFGMPDLILSELKSLELLESRFHDLNILIKVELSFKHARDIFRAIDADLDELKAARKSHTKKEMYSHVKLIGNLTRVYNLLYDDINGNKRELMKFLTSIDGVTSQIDSRIRIQLKILSKANV